MPSYQIELHPTASKELHNLTESRREQLTDTLIELSEQREPTQHPRVKHLEGHAGLFRVRCGSVRAICELQKPNLRILRIGTRDTVYEIIDDIDERRVTS